LRHSKGSSYAYHASPEPGFCDSYMGKEKLMNEDIFRTLQKRLDTYSLGFPQTQSGVEIEILRKLFTKEDAELFLALTPLLEPPQAIAGRLGMPVADISARLEDMANRGLLFRLKKYDSVKYGAVPFMHGLLEFQIKRLDKEMAELFERYYHEGFYKAIVGSSDIFLRTIPVNQSIDVRTQVAPFDDACEILRNTTLIAVAQCICRKEKGMIGNACGRPVEVCFMFGSMAQYYLDNKMGRKVDTDEAISILKDAQDAGLVTQPATSQNPSGMCNCCGDCCGILTAVKKFPEPAKYIFSNHYAVVDADACSSCGICTDRCPMGAVQMDDDEIACMDLDRCIGCGLCVTTCPAQAISLFRKSDKCYRTPPVTSAEQMMLMAHKRGIEF